MSASSCKPRHNDERFPTRGNNEGISHASSGPNNPACSLPRLCHWLARVGANDPDTILYEPGARKLCTFNGKSNDVSVIDAVTLKPVATIKVGGTPEFAVGDRAGRIFVNIESSAEIVVLDVAAYDPDSGTVFSSNGDGTLSVIRQLDADHHSAATLATVKGARTMAFDQASKKVYLPSVTNQVFTVLVVAP